ncbi:hypothetical protein [Candidatus Nitrosopumilus sediminis]|uniref:Uncharacterized protein n=1 Tax=Candidatus Nitrosopumilus sediminis TaxID=1229909 RepID=K0BFL7_9ARCH|nr:hypothetical protein [Candidatus Nitrosopumilus sediminis]AFS83106.1 hypothetical protein NSED_06530 [Candidatus Nitrosopumilus sediminis]
MNNKTIFVVFFTVSILLLGTISSSVNLIPSADALKGQGVPSSQYGSATKGIVCGDKLCSEVEQEEKKVEKKIEKKAEKKEQAKTEKKESEKKKLDDKAASEKARYDELSLPPRTIKTGTVTSTQDPGQGHENHQLAIILPPSDKVYRGIFAFTVSENVQLVTLHGPLKNGEDKGQAIWSPDGKTKYALTFVPLDASAGTWAFAGNALAVHTMNEDPFTVSYSVAYRERTLSDTVKSETITSTQDPGQGHENHQLAIILPPRPYAYFGTLGFSASEDVQLVALHGPLQPGQGAHGQAIWTPDGKTFYALTFVDKETAMGTWQFTGNAVALHTMKDTPFTVSYSIATGQ